MPSAGASDEKRRERRLMSLIIAFRLLSPQRTRPPQRLEVAPCRTGTPFGVVAAIPPDLIAGLAKRALGSGPAERNVTK
jgi:hypothetical protein